MTLYEETVSRSPWSGCWSVDGSQERLAAVIVVMSKTTTTMRVIIIDLGIRSDSEPVRLVAVGSAHAVCSLTLRS